MTKRRLPGKASKRYPFGPRPISALLAPCTRRVFRHRSPSLQRLLLDWPLIVGPRIAAMAIPERVLHATLTLACNGPGAVELQHGAPELVERINTYFGERLVEALSLHQRLMPEPVPPPPAQEPAPAATTIPAGLVDLPRGDLRSSLLRLARTLERAAHEERIHAAPGERARPMREAQ